MAYVAVSVLSKGQEGLAVSHSQDIIHLERSLGLYVEPWLQSWVNGSVVGWLLSEFYLLAHPLITLGFIVGLFLSSARSYPRIRNIFVAFSLISFATYLVYPAAPPRMVPGSGLHDLVEQSGAVSYDRAVMRYLMLLVDPYAAMPSVHFGYSLIVGGFLFTTSRRRSIRILGLSYPSVMLFSVASTGNHFISDCAASVPLLLLSILMVDWIDARSSNQRRAASRGL